MTTEERLSQLDAQKSAIIAEVRGWPLELQHARPAGGGWSALQVLDHVVRTEREVCEVIGGSAERGRIGLRDRVGFVFVEQVFRSPRRVKVPRSVEKLVWPGEAMDLAEIEATWHAVRLQVANVAAQSKELRGGVFRHPVSGWMTLEQVLRFFEAHMVHHRFQLERIKGELGATSRSR